MAKTRTIRLTSGWPNRDLPLAQRMQQPLYRVEMVTDSVSPTPGHLITQREVEAMCQSARWKVTILPRHLSDERTNP